MVLDQNVLKRSDVMRKHIFVFCLILGLTVLPNILLKAGEARLRWEMMNQIRKDKFDIILPKVMRENKIDMWITMVKEGNVGPLYEDFGRGYVSSIGYYIFTDRGGKKVRIPIEDDAIVTHNGIEWLYPINTRILLIR
jgi:hypothetical protein